MNQVLILAISVLVPSVVLVIIARQYLAYRQHKTQADAAHNAAYRQLAESIEHHNTDIAHQLRDINSRLHAVEQLLRSID